MPDDTCRGYDVDGEPVIAHGGGQLDAEGQEHLATIVRATRRRFGIDALKRLLAEVERHDTNYVIRYPLVVRALGIAAELGYVVGIALDPAEPAWPVVYIELPAGQVSWHMPAYGGEYDGHTTPEKYQRIRDFIAREQP
ncbi:hypothetical protein VA596_41530 [Amycolatopsis sp., V23-08]|uniref:DUF5753 domain-containing protein n=1 Tax=Amycolatopsis heterodermiae TaxID=3110235 RepID=A0ABU5RIF7_9PSEU|nr:hypothetical protein [Amycolatopsis sp., V23-08]MEA5366068.1 hypothetical protein [Amycolatopsis sp., V23-08]